MLHVIRSFMRIFLLWGGLFLLVGGLTIFAFQKWAGTSHRSTKSSTILTKLRSGLFPIGSFAKKHLNMKNLFKDSSKQVTNKRLSRPNKRTKPCQKGKKCTNQAQSKQENKGLITYRNVDAKHTKFLRKKGIRIDGSGHIFVDSRKSRKVRIIGLSGRATMGKKLLRGNKRRGDVRTNVSGKIGKSNAMIIDSKGNVYVLKPNKN